MAAKRKLAAVPDDAKAPKGSEEPKSLAEAVKTGDYRTILVAQRNEIALALPDEKGPAKAALHRQLTLIAKEIASLDAARSQEVDEDGDIRGDEAWDETAI